MNINATPLDAPDIKLRVGLIVDSEFASKHVYELAEWAQAQDTLSISHLVIQNASDTSRTSGLLDSIRLKLFAIITKFDNLRIQGDKNYKDHLKLFNLKSIIRESVAIEPEISKPGSIYEYSTKEVGKVKDLNLDVLIQFGSGTLRGDILKSARFGVITIIHGDDRVKRGGPPGFWEVYFKQDNTGFTIQHLSDKPGGSDVLVRGRFQTKAFFLLNQASLYEKSYYYLQQLLSKLAVTRALPAAMDLQPYFNPPFEMPNLREQMKYLSYLGSKIAWNAINRVRSKRDCRWSVAYMKSDWKALTMWKANKIKNPPNHFLADPFVIHEGNRDYCFLEDFDYKTSRGFISVYELKDESAERLGEVLVEPFHLSFPYLFRFNSKLYMCPETSGNNDIRVYECVKFPLEWKLAKSLKSNISAVDTMIFERDGLWWLFTNIDPTHTGNHFSELFIFYSDNPLSHTWHPHPQNPVLIDSSRGRNAGIVFDDNWVYRVSQRQGFNTYGKGFSINRITALNKEEYSETEFCSVEPNFFPNLIGCHHLHSNGSISVFDYLRYTRVNY
jgi:hypothetical protein